ncbi:BREX system P-loop protein BrxC [Calditrichota bacterium GD2]
MKIRELFSKPIDRKIEEVVKVDQDDQETIKQEIEEYVLTETLKKHFYTLYEAMLEYQRDPHEGIGVWVSGFFGSGKSSFAKIFGYTLLNQKLGAATASEYFIQVARDAQISNYIKTINARFNIHAVIFDVSMDRGVRTANDRITEIMYKVLLRQLGYAEDFDLAQVEIDLELENRLEEFKKRYFEKYHKPWDTGKKITTHALNETGNILHEMFPDKFSTPDSWLYAIGQQGRADIDPNKLAQLTFELMARRKPGYGVIYIIDEVGQYVARSTDKMLDLQAVVQALGKESKKRVKDNKAPIPAWVIVTSQEKLDEVVDALNEHRIELARLQDRFPISIDLQQSDIKEVTAKRILDKKDEAKKLLEDLFDQYEGRLKTNTTLERTHRNVEFSKQDFVELYPYLPYQIELSINIVSGLRLKRGAHRHVGGSNRTIIKQAQQLLIHPQTNLGDKPLGTLVTLDMIYELLEGGSLLASEIVAEINAIREHLKDDEMALKVAKAIALLEVVRDLPRTVHNIAAVLHPSVQSESRENEVEAALERLMEAQFVKETNGGYKLLTIPEKTWDTEKRTYHPKERDKHEYIEEFIKNIFSEPNSRIYRYKNRATFPIAITLRNKSLFEGSVRLNLRYSNELSQLESLKNETRRDSRQSPNEIFWVFSLNDELHNKLVELYRSRSMIREYGRLRSQNQISRDEGAFLDEERQEEQRLIQQLKSLLTKALENGSAIFNGLERDGATLGDKWSEMVRNILTEWVPQIYPKLELGARNLSGKEAEEVLTANDLRHLSHIFFDSKDGLKLITRQGDKYLPDPNAPVAQEIFNYIKKEYDYGNTVSGKLLEAHFSAPPYGWERDLLRMVLAVLFRAGKLEVTSEGQKYKDYSQPEARAPFIKNPVFRKATFAPKKTMDLKTLTTAARFLEEILGQEVDIDETKISQLLKEIAANDREDLRELTFRMQPLDLPGLEELKTYEETLNFILKGNSEDCVHYLAGSGKTFREQHQLQLSLQKVITPQNLEIVSKARAVVEKIWPLLKESGENGDLETLVKNLHHLLQTRELYDHLPTIDIDAQRIYERFAAIYKEKHAERENRIARAIEKLKGHQRFADLEEHQQQQLLRPLFQRTCETLHLNNEGICQNCQANIKQLESDILSVEQLYQDALRKLIEMTTDSPNEIVTIDVQNYLHGNYQSIEEFREELKKLQEDIEKLILEGKKIFIK